MVKVNLVPSEILVKAAQKQQNVQIFLGVFVVLLGVAGVSFWHLKTAQREEADLAVKERRLAELQVEVALVENLKKGIADLRNRLNVVNNLLKGRRLYPNFMSDFIETVPSGIYIKTLRTNSTATSVTLELAAEALSSEEIKEWISRLAAAGFSGVEMGPVLGTETVPPTYGFTLKGQYAAKP